MKTLAFAGAQIIAQLLWFWAVTSLAHQQPDASMIGAYCALWMLGIPVVALATTAPFLFKK